MELEIYQLGIAGVALIFIIEKGYELFKYVLKRYNPPDNNYEKKQYDATIAIGENHLGDILEAINCGNDKMTKAITDMHTDLSGKLGEIKGVLSK